MKIDELEEAGGSPVTINRYALAPADVAWVPRGKVLHVGFLGQIAYAWVMHSPAAAQDAQILTVPSEQVINIETDPLYETPRHVGSFFKTDSSKLLPSAWHCFLFMPKSKGAIVLPS